MLSLRRKLYFNLRRSFATVVAIKSTETTPTNVLPFSAVPTQSKFQVWRSFMPGGEFGSASILEYAIQMHKRHGDLFLMPGLFGKPNLLMTFNTKDIEMVFRQDAHFPRREGFDSVTYFREKVRPDLFKQTKGLISEQGEDWRKLRAVSNPVLMQPRNLRIYVEPLAKVNDEFIERIKSIRHPQSLEVPADFADEAMRLIFESISLVALNRKMGIIGNSHANPDAETLFRTSREVFRMIYKLDIQPSLWKLLPTPTFKRMMTTLEESAEITEKFVDEAKRELEQKQRSGQHSGEFSMLEKLINIDPKIASTMAMDIMFAGVDATATSLLAVLLCLAKHPEKQNKLRAELLKVMPAKNSMLEEQALADLPYLRAVIKETFRYYPNAAGTFRTLGEDAVLSGYHIPKGTRVVLAANVLLRDERYFPQAEAFLPERWLRAGKDQAMRSEVVPFSYLPFGFGARSCIGKRIVDMELEVSVSKIIRNFTIEFNYDASKPFKSLFTMEPAIPFMFKFSDVAQ